MHKVLTKAKRKITSTFFVDSNQDYRNTVLLSGTGRSGTTWVSHLINYNNEYRYIFEPFHQDKVDACSGFKYRQYLRPENESEYFINAAKVILSGNIRNSWTDRFNDKLISNKRLIKDIRAMHLLKWIYVNFPGIPIILIIRHPLAVAHSKMKLKWGTHLEEFLAQSELMEDFLNPFEKQIKNAQTTFEKHIFLWCIENYVPLRQFNEGEILVVFYEKMCARPLEEMDKVVTFLDKKLNNRILGRLGTASEVCRKDSAIYTRENLISSWVKYFSVDQINKAVDILKMFGLNNIYSRNPMPQEDGLGQILKENVLQLTEQD